MIDEKLVSTHGLNRACDSLPMLLAEEERSHDEQVERSLQKGNPVVIGLSCRHSTQRYSLLGRMSTGERQTRNTRLAALRLKEGCVRSGSYPRRLATGAAKPSLK